MKSTKLNANAIETSDLREFLRQHPFLAQLIPTTGVVFQCDGDAPSPSKDYGQLEINLDKVDRLASLSRSSHLCL